MRAMGMLCVAYLSASSAAANRSDQWLVQTEAYEAAAACTATIIHRIISVDGDRSAPGLGKRG